MKGVVKEQDGWKICQEQARVHIKYDYHSTDGVEFNILVQGTGTELH